MRNSIFFGCLFAALLFVSSSIQAQEGELQNLLVDNNGDGFISILAFGDSITYGIGDEGEGGGYPSRLELMLNLPVDNEGAPGEDLIPGGMTRYPEAVQKSDFDISLIMEGANDAWKKTSGRTYQKTLQRLINVSVVLGRTPVLMTLPKPEGEHSGVAPFAAGFSNIIRELGKMNQVPVVDLERVWKLSCANKSDCEYYQQPDGLHPNGDGYTLMAQAIAGSLLGLNIFEQGAAEELEQILGLPAGSVLFKAEPQVVEVGQ